MVMDMAVTEIGTAIVTTIMIVMTEEGTMITMDGTTNTLLMLHINKSPGKIRGFVMFLQSSFCSRLNNYFFNASAIVLPVSAGLATT